MNLSTMMKNFVILSVLLGGCSISLAQDIPPPPGYQPPVYQEPVVLEGVFPLTSPDPFNGGLIYIENCLPCHGERGLGNGPQASQLSIIPASIGAAEIANQASPIVWFSMVTLGNMNNFMPPFFDKLSDQDRWDVLAYVYSLSAVPATMLEGEDIYINTCSQCHGSLGDGNGDEQKVEFDFTNHELMIDISAKDIIGIITPGLAEDVHIFEQSLDAGQRQAAASYVRALTIENISVAEFEEFLAEQEEAISQAQEIETVVENLFGEEKFNINISGIVSNLSEKIIPQDLTLTLVALTHNSEIYRLDGSLFKGDGYLFEDVPSALGLFYYVVAEYQGVKFVSDFVQIEAGITEFDLPISIYEIKQDTEELALNQLLVFFSFVTPNVVEVTELYIFSNYGDYVIAPENIGEPNLQFDIPENVPISSLSFRDGFIGERFIASPGGFADTAPIFPGEESYEVVFAYSLPYGVFGGRYNNVVDFNIENLIFLVPENSVSIKGDGVEYLDMQSFGGVDYDIYRVIDNINNQNIEVELTGLHPASGVTLFFSGENNNLLVGFGGFILMLFGVVLWMRQLSRNVTSITPDQIMDEIIDLDIAYEDGEIDEGEYKLTRHELKSLLRNEIDEEK